MRDLRRYTPEPFSITNKQAEVRAEEKAKKVFDKGLSFMQKFKIDTNKKYVKE